MLTWSFPSGKLNHSESAEQAVVREVLEETGYYVRAEKVIHHGIHPLSRVFASYIACTLIKGAERKNVLDPAIRTVSWVPLSGLAMYFGTTVNPAVQRYLGYYD
jgi:A/G-specific adenine glycosylase